MGSHELTHQRLEGVRRRAKAGGIATEVCNHTFRGRHRSQRRRGDLKDLRWPVVDRHRSFQNRLGALQRRAELEVKIDAARLDYPPIASGKLVRTTGQTELSSFRRPRTP